MFCFVIPNDSYETYVGSEKMTFTILHVTTSDVEAQVSSKDPTESSFRSYKSYSRQVYATGNAH